VKIIYECQLWLNAILKAIPGEIGCHIRNFILPYKNGKNVKIWAHTHIDSPSKLIVGNNVSINRHGILNAGGGIEIGNDVLIGPNVTIYSQNHNFNNPDRLIREQGYSVNKVTIENNVWIASNVTILPGITIGENTVIAANTLVNKNIESNSLIAGNPARTIRKITKTNITG